MKLTSLIAWWTNKRLFWFAVWAWLIAIGFLVLEQKKEFIHDSLYRVTWYRYRVPQGSRIETGDRLAAREEIRITKIRTLGFVSLVAAIVSTMITVRRLLRGEKIFREAFAKDRPRPDYHEEIELGRRLREIGKRNRHP
jgi:hypothetical protein